MIPSVLLHTLKAHKGTINSLVYTTDGEFVLSCGSDCSFRIWNPTEGTHIKDYQGHNLSVNDIKASTDNSKIISASEDKLAILWDVATGRFVRKLYGHNLGLNCVQNNPEMTIALTGSLDKSIRLWDLRANSKDPLQTLNEAKGSISCLDFKNNQILSGSTDGVVRNYDIRMGKLFSDNIGFPITSLSFSHDFNCFLVSTLDSKIRLFDISNGEILNNFNGHQNKLYKVKSEMTLNDEFVVSGSEDGFIYFWDLLTGNLRHNFKLSSSITSCLSYHPSKHQMVCSSGNQIFVFST